VRSLLIVSLLGLPGLGQTIIYNPQIDNYAPVWYRGYRSGFQAIPLWITAYPVDWINTETNEVTATTLPPSTSDPLWFTVYPVTREFPSIYTTRRYTRCSSSTTFLMREEWGSCSAGRFHPFTSAGDAGNGLYLGRRLSLTSGAQAIYQLTLPPGVTLVDGWYNSGSALIWQPVHGGGWDASGNNGVFLNFRFAIAVDAPLGPAAITVTVIKRNSGHGYADGQVVKTLSVPFTIADPPLPIPEATPAAFTAISPATLANLRTKWQYQGNNSPSMKRACDETTGVIVDAEPETPANNPMGIGGESGIDYYDGALGYLWGFRLLPKPIFKQCALSIATWYRDRILANDSQLQPSRRFTDGLLQIMAEVPDYATYRRAILKNLVDANPPYSRGEPPNGAFHRDRAYAVLNVIRAAEACGVTRLHQFRLLTTECGVSWIPYRIGLERNVDFLFDALATFAAPPSNEWQTFMAGLTAQALARFYEFSWDEWSGPGTGYRRHPRVLRALADYADWYWTHQWDPVSNKQYSANSPLGIGCSHSCRPSQNRILINLSATGMMAFLYYYTGEERFQTRAHQLLQWGLTDPIGPDGKVTSQNLAFPMYQILGYMLGHGRYPQASYTLPL
jgi:hypothetical protein